MIYLNLIRCKKYGIIRPNKDDPSYHLMNYTCLFNTNYVIKIKQLIFQDVWKLPYLTDPLSIPVYATLS